MKLIGLAWRSLANRRFAVALTIATITLSVALVVLVEQLRAEVREGFYRSVAGTDLIVGARTAPVQLLLYSIFGIGEATNNVSIETYREITADPLVEWAIPMALGDAHRGFRVMGTTGEMFEHFRYADRRALEFSRGRAFEDLFEVVVGHQVARRLGYAPGDEIVIAHGGGRTQLHHHDDHPFTVSGVLAATGTPVDQTVYISLAAHRAIHVGWERGVPRPGGGIDPHTAREQADELEPGSITAFLLGLRTRAAAFGLQRRINEYRAEPLTAALPGVALQEVWRITSLAEQVLRVVAGLVVAAGLLGMLTVLLATLNERRREMAILRAVGARPWQIGALLVLEAGVIVAAGILLGVGAAWAVQGLAAPWLLEVFAIAVSPGLPAAGLWLVLGGIFAAGLIVALVPALMAYRRTLADGMQVRS